MVFSIGETCDLEARRRICESGSIKNWPSICAFACKVAWAVSEGLDILRFDLRVLEMRV